MNKTILHFILLITLSITLHAKMVDGIALIVEGEAVTTAEIRALKTQLRISRNEAIDMLIQDRLQKTAMKDITVPQEDIDKKISEIATQNKLTIPKMRKILAKQGTPWVQYRKNIQEALKKNIFFQKEILPSIPTPSQDELKLFYTQHKKLFTMPARILVKEYSSSSQKNINMFTKTGKSKYVKSKRITKSTKTMEPSLLRLLLQTANGKYTSPINTGNKYIVFKVLSKQGKRIMPFEGSQEAIIMQWKTYQQNKTLKDYFEKLRTDAHIQKLR